MSSNIIGGIDPNSIHQLPPEIEIEKGELILLSASFV